MALPCIRRNHVCGRIAARSRTRLLPRNASCRRSGRRMDRSIDLDGSAQNILPRAAVRCLHRLCIRTRTLCRRHLDRCTLYIFNRLGHSLDGTRALSAPHPARDGHRLCDRYGGHASCNTNYLTPANGQKPPPDIKKRTDITFFEIYSLTCACEEVR